MTLTGSPTFQLDGYLHGIRAEFDRLNRELDEARKQRDEYKINYWSKDKELRELIAFLHRLNGKEDQSCQYCKGEITHTAAFADDNPAISPASPSSEYHSPLEEKSIVPAPLDKTGDSIAIGPVDVREGAISVESEDPTIASPPLGSDTNEVGKSTWSVKYNGDTEIALDLVHELTQEGGSRIAFSPDGKYLATASMDRIVCIFDVNTGERICIMRDLYRNPDEARAHSCLGFSPNNSYLATGGEDNNVTIWIIPQRRVRNIFRLGDYIRDLNFSPNGKFLVTCSFDKTVRIWRLRDGFSRVLTSGRDSPWAVRFSPDGRYVASGYNPRKILIWNASSGRLVARWEGHDGPVSSLMFTPDGKSLLTASWDMTVVRWDVAWLNLLEIAPDNAEGEQDVKSTVTEIASFVGHKNEVDALSISPDGKWIASGSYDKTVRIWNAHDATLQCTLDFPSQVLSIVFGPVGTYIAIGGKFESEVQQVTIWNYASLR